MQSGPKTSSSRPTSERLEPATFCLYSGLLAYHEHYEGNPITHEVLWETQSVLASIEKLETDSMLNQFSTIGLTHQGDDMMDCGGEQSAGMGSGCGGIAFN